MAPALPHVRALCRMTVYFLVDAHPPTSSTTTTCCTPPFQSHCRSRGRHKRSVNLFLVISYNTAQTKNNIHPHPHPPIPNPHPHPPILHTARDRGTRWQPPHRRHVSRGIHILHLRPYRRSLGRLRACAVIWPTLQQNWLCELRLQFEPSSDSMWQGNGLLLRQDTDRNDHR